MSRQGERLKRVALPCVAVGCAIISALSGCRGGGSDNAKPGKTPDMTGSMPPDMTGSMPPDCQGSQINAGPSPLRRLTRTEYNNTVHDLLGDSTGPAKKFPDEELTLGFPNIATAQSVSVLLIEQYEAAADALATAATQDPKKLMGCDPSGADQESCVRAFVTSFGLKAYRRPLEKDEIDRLVSFFQTSAKDADAKTGVKLVVQAILQSASFIYRLEPSDQSQAGRVHRLTGYEIASRLSYMIWGTMPDKDLLDAAASGKLDTDDGVAEQAQRLLAASQAKAQMETFFTYWLDLDKIAAVDKSSAAFPKFTADVRALLQRQDEAFLADVAFGGGKLDALLRSNYTYLNKDLAAFYGVSGPTGSDFEKFTWPDDKRRGFLGMAGYLASSAKSNQTSPVQRGMFVRERFFCTTPPPPPPTVNTSIPPPDPKQTTRQRFAEHEKNDSCAGCHKLMDPIGLGLENFDGAGLWRDKDGDNAVDDSGEIVGADVAGKFNGLSGLTDLLAKSQDVKDCVVKQWFRFGYGRREETVDQCSLSEIGQAFADSEGDFPKLVLALTRTDAFVNRTEEGK